MKILTAAPEHEAGIGALLVAAFGGPDEASLVADLRVGGYASVSLVAADGGGIAGYVMFSRLEVIAAGRVLRSVAVAPLAVRADLRGQGLGTRLMETGIESCRRARIEAVVVLGDPRFYGRLGFSPETVRSLDCAFAGPHLQGLELVRGVLIHAAGQIAYPAPFGRFIR